MIIIHPRIIRLNTKIGNLITLIVIIMRNFHFCIVIFLVRFSDSIRNQRIASNLLYLIYFLFATHVNINHHSSGKFVKDQKV